jgi:phospholipid transport system substrate-binding protein
LRPEGGGGERRVKMRRVSLGWIIGAFFLWGSLSLSPWAMAGEPLEIIRSSTEQVMQILKDPALKDKPQIRDERLWEVVSARFDFEEMARRSLALHWRERTPEERAEFVDLFSHLLFKAYVGKLEGYTDEKVEYLREEIRGSWAEVSTKLTGKSLDISIDYRMIKKPAGWMIYDVEIEGVSLVNNYRSQFNRIVVSEGYAELVKRMRTKWQDLIRETGIKPKKRT